MNTVAIVHDNSQAGETFHLCGDCGMWSRDVRTEQHKCWKDYGNNQVLLEEAFKWASNLPTDNATTSDWVLDQLNSLPMPAFVVSRLF